MSTTLVLALDTTSRPGSSALLRGTSLLDVSRGDPTKSHAERLPAEVVGLLARHGLSVGDVDVFAVASGPGSFTGLRVGIASMQGLAFALSRPVVAVSALDALAQIGAGWDAMSTPVPRPPGTVIGVVMDAQRREVFATLLQVSVAGGAGGRDAGPWQEAVFQVLEEPTAEPPDVVFARWATLAPLDGAAVELLGDGAVLYREQAGRHLGSRATVRDAVPPLAPMVACLARVRAERGEATPPHAVRPVYVRRPDAELAREGRQRAESQTP